MPKFGRDALPWQRVELSADGGVQLRLHLPGGTACAVVMVGGVGGGFDTPGKDLYPRLAEDLAGRGVGAVRVRFRNPRSLDDAVVDVRAALRWLRGNGVTRSALVGHSFGGAVVIRVALDEPSVAAVVTLATQSYGTEKVHELGRPLLVVHGDDDPILPHRSSVDVARRAGELAELRLLAGSGHDLLEHREDVRRLVRGWLEEQLPAVG